MKLLITLIYIFSVSFLYSQQVIVLGIAQDGGFPHIGCQNECLKAHKNKNISKYVTSLALVDLISKKWWMFEATPDMDRQLQYFRDLTDGKYPYLPEGIFVTHAHIGHYTGLMFLGKEALGAQGVKVYALPKMSDYLKSHGPWSQLVDFKNISLHTLIADSIKSLSTNLSVEAFTVPHRDEYSETAGFKVLYGNKGFIFIPDIDKWHKWDRNIIDIIRDPQINYAFIDATFFKDGELPNRPMRELPHPFAEETMRLFNDESLSIKEKIKFIHLNHTNPLIFDRRARQEVYKKGFGVAEQGTIYD
ncbi:MBL fold metallo-hydrolase [Ekhidna sp.]|uniref:MBL fold metallo-hydrolase n=1 Tax=Ekhidna sp. TaxID=2608089 RepID=UPI003B512374